MAARRPVRRRTTRIPLKVKPSGKPFKIICGECYEEVVFEPREGVKEIYCGECDHGGMAPDQEWLRRWAYFKGIEYRNVAVAGISAALMVLVGVIWTLFLFDPFNWVWNMTNYVFLGVEIVLMALVVVFGVLYEKNKYEAYF